MAKCVNVGCSGYPAHPDANAERLTDASSCTLVGRQKYVSRLSVLCKCRQFCAGLHDSLLSNPGSCRTRLRNHLPPHKGPSGEQLCIPLYRYAISPAYRTQDTFLTLVEAGKDRTGVLAALLLKLAGVDDDTIAEDYALTRVGREPAREMVMARLARMPMFAANNEAALNMLTSRCVCLNSAGHLAINTCYVGRKL